MSDGGAFSMGFANAYRMMMDREEKKRQEEASRAIGQMYIESLRAPADAAVAPFQANAITGRSNAFDAQTRAEASKMTDMAIASNPALTQRVAGTNAPITPEMQAGFAINNQAALGQANQQAQGADQMLSLAKEKYGTAMFDRLGPIVASGKVPPQAMIAIIEKQIQAAEKTALKQATASAVKILSDPNADPAQKQSILGQLMVDNPQAARGLAEAFGLKPYKGPDLVTPGSYVRQPDGSYKQMGTPSNQNLSANTVYAQQQANERAKLRTQNQQPKKAEWEKEHHDYEKTHGMNDAQLVQEYWSMSQDPAQSALITPDKQTKYNVAAARVNKYLGQPNLTVDEQEFLSGIDRSKVSKEEGFKMLQQYRMNKLNGIRQ